MFANLFADCSGLIPSRLFTRGFLFYHRNIFQHKHFLPKPTQVWGGRDNRDFVAKPNHARQIFVLPKWGTCQGDSTGSFLQRVEADADVLGPPDEAALNAVDAVGAAEASDAVGDDVNPEAVDDAVVPGRRMNSETERDHLRRLSVIRNRASARISREKACRAVTLS